MRDARLQQALASGIRETDVRGWYKRGTVVGIVFTELQSAAPHVRDILIRRVMARLVGQIDPDVLFKIKVTFHMFPEDEANGHSCGHFDLDCHKDLAKKTAKRDLSSRVKILKDVVGELLDDVTNLFATDCLSASKASHNHLLLFHPSGSTIAGWGGLHSYRGSVKDSMQRFIFCGMQVP